MRSLSPSPFAQSILRRLPVHIRRLSSQESSRNDLIISFSELVKRFPNKAPCASPPPVTGARPRCPHPFEYASMMEAYGRAGDADEALRLLREMKSFSCRPDVVCYTAVIDSLASSGRPAEALAVFEEMASAGAAPDAAAFTVLVKLYACCLMQFDVAYEVVRWMVKSGCAPDVVTYSTLIAGLCWAGRIEEALGVLDLMLEEECRPNVYTYTPIVQAYCCRGRIKEAKRLLNTMEAIGCPPNTVTFNVLIEALCKIAAFDEVEMLMKDCALKGWEPDTITYSIYMDGLCKFGRAEKSFELIEVMLEKGLCPNDLTLNILLDGLCRGSKACEAKCLLERSAELEWNATVVNYNTVMSRLSDIGRWSAVLKLFTDMFKKGITANSWTFSIVIHSLSKTGMLNLAKFVFNSKGFVANVMTYTTLIHYYSLAGRPHDVHLLFQKMAEESISPNRITYSVMINCLCKDKRFLEAIGCFYRSLGDGYSSDLVAHLMYNLVSCGRLKEMINLLQWILKQGTAIDVCIFHKLINAFCRMGYCKSAKIYDVCHILDKMLQIR
ncbi:pentatricopeptide repeat-containing protein [Canna indica]|uniref:Pentatricopeptide repeat-containing protein n=1 Tax=Canna indica TaxID=4628 RepID=A0AAQ3JNW7_9LILI|nr:pentatricopeptide repeat-containing protein [Canna indica]